MGEGGGLRGSGGSECDRGLRTEWEKRLAQKYVCDVPDGLLRVYSARLPLARSRAFCNRMGLRIIVRLGANCPESRGSFATLPAFSRALRNAAPALALGVAVDALKVGVTKYLLLINE